VGADYPNLLVLKSLMASLKGEDELALVLGKEIW
jgi:hypothetical protein